ncbi:MAG: hypothetical protein RIR70_1912, partial [Pseudomonadota bacterium]
PAETDDLFFRESALLHARHSPRFDGLRELSGGTGCGEQVSGWWLLISVTVLGLIPLIFFLFQKGSTEANQYGDPV